METIKDQLEKLYEFLPTDAKAGKGHPVRKKRVLVGRSQACDIVIPHSDITAIHAIVEVTPTACKVFDMNSKNGTFVNGEKVVARNFGVGDSIKFATHEFTFKEYSAADVAIPPLDMLDPELPPAMDQKPALPKQAPEFTKEDFEEIPRVEYPLAADPKAEFSEYIFEDTDTLYPIFHYGVDKAAVEIIILYKDKIFSVDYVPLRNGTYNLVGSRPNSSDVEYAYLGQKEKFPFVNVQNDEVFINPLPGYEFLSINDENENPGGSSINLQADDILRFKNQDLQVFVRGTEAPPKVDSAPILRRDDDFKKYLLLMFILIFSFLGTMSFITVDKELEQEKVPERIATILYKKKPKFIIKKQPAPTPKITKKAKPQPQKQKISKKKPTTTQAKKSAKKIVNRVSRPTSGSRSAKKQGKLKTTQPKKGPKNNIKVVRASRNKAKGSRSAKKSVPRNTKRVAKSRGAVETYKSADFKSTLSSLMAKGGATKKVERASTFEGSSGISSSIADGGPSAQAERAEIKSRPGRLSDETGKLDDRQGTQGIQTKRRTYTAGIPFKTVVLGGMDPDIIRKILEDHIPQFRYCYQSVLDRAKSSFNGLIQLNFIIGASGNVTKAAVDSRSRLPSKVKRCVVNVLRGIPFPEPMGGGVVEVNQPMNFYSINK